MKSSKKSKTATIKMPKTRLAKRNKTTPEITIAEWKKNTTEVVRVKLLVFRGENYFSIRTWYRDARGQLKPGKNGINLRIADHLLTLRKALRKARDLAKNFPGSNYQPVGGL